MDLFHTKQWKSPPVYNRLTLKAGKTKLIEFAYCLDPYEEFDDELSHLDLHSMLQIRRGNRDNLGILAIFLHKTYFATHH